MSPAFRMLCYLAWTGTRRFFLLGLFVLLAQSFALFMSYPGEPGLEFPHGAIAIGVEQVRALPQDARSYIWLRWFGNTLVLWLTFLALAVAGIGLGPHSRHAGFALSLPISRRALAGIHVAVGFLELLAAAVVSSLAVAILAAVRGAAYAFSESIIHALIAVAAVSAFYGFFVFLSATLGDVSKGIIGVAILLLYGMFTFLSPAVRHYSVFRLMTGDTLFLGGTVPWPGLAACMLFGLAWIFASFQFFEHRDY